MSEQRAKEILSNVIQKTLKRAETIEDFNRIINLYLSHGDSKLGNVVEKYNLNFMIDNGRKMIDKDDIGIDNQILGEDFEGKDNLSEFDSLKEFLSIVPEETPAEIMQTIIGEIENEQDIETDAIENVDIRLKKTTTLVKETFEYTTNNTLIKSEDIIEVDTYSDKNFFNDYKQYGMKKNDISNLKKGNDKGKSVVRNLLEYIAGVNVGIGFDSEVNDFADNLKKIGADEKIIVYVTEAGSDKYYDNIKTQIDVAKNTYEIQQQQMNDKQEKLRKAEEKLKKEKQKIKNEKKKLKKEKQNIKNEKHSLNNEKLNSEMEKLDSGLTLDKHTQEIINEIALYKSQIDLLDSEIAKKTEYIEDLKIEEKLVKEISSVGKRSVKLTSKEISKIISKKHLDSLNKEMVKNMGKYDSNEIVAALKNEGMEEEANIVEKLFLGYDNKLPESAYLQAANKLEKLGRRVETRDNDYKDMKRFLRVSGLNRYHIKDVLTKEGRKFKKDLKAKNFDNLDYMLSNTIRYVEENMDTLNEKSYKKFKSGLDSLKIVHGKVKELKESDIPDLPYRKIANALNKAVYLQNVTHMSKETADELKTMAKVNKKFEFTYEGKDIKIKEYGKIDAKTAEILSLAYKLK